MHETALARQLLELALTEAEAAGARRVVRLRGWVAETESLSAESLQLHFQAHAVGTVAAGAVLDLELRHVRARCRGCGVTYLPEHHLLLCEACGGTDAEVLGETGLKIEAVEVE